MTEHTIDTFYASAGPRTKVTSWNHGSLECVILKFPPTMKAPTTFVVVGRASPELEFSQYGHPQTSFIKTKEIFDKLTDQMAELFNKDGTYK